jgi:hypothetical protein
LCASFAEAPVPRSGEQISCCRGAPVGASVGIVVNGIVVVVDVVAAAAVVAVVAVVVVVVATTSLVVDGNFTAITLNNTTINNNIANVMHVTTLPNNGLR